MADSKRWAPYAPPATVIHAIRHYRQRDVPPKITTTDLIQIGVTEALAPRTLGALEFLRLIGGDGETTDAFRSLRYATDDEYHSVFGAILQQAYQDIFDKVDPTSATVAQTTNAFFPYSPGGQRSRMVTLFLGLCQEAGIAVREAPKQVGTRSAGSVRPKTAGSPPRSSAGGGNRRSPGDGGHSRDQQRTFLSGEGLLFGITEDDVANLSPEEFEAVWGALGKVARARASARVRRTSKPEEGGDDE